MKKTALITGASSGFGEAIAKKLSSNGYKLILLARRKERLENLKSLLSSEIHLINGDIRDKNFIFDEIAKLPLNFQDIEILVNNAGLALGQDKTQDADICDFETMIDTNIKGLLYTTKAVLPLMLKNKNGYIFNIGSIAGTYSYPGGNVYGGTKAFVKQFSNNLRNDLVGENIRVTTIAPGLCKTEFSEVRFKGDKQKADKVYENTLYTTADDIAQVIEDCLKMNPRTNINYIELMATTQTWAGFAFERF